MQENLTFTVSSGEISTLTHLNFLFSGYIDSFYIFLVYTVIYVPYRKALNCTIQKEPSLIILVTVCSDFQIF